MKKKGFTLVELLATIVVLSVIALIATPIILNVIEKAKKGALVSSVNGLVESANMYYANNTIKGETVTEIIFDFEDGEQISIKKLEYKGKVYNGKLILTSDSKVTTCIDDGKYYAYKEADSDEVISGIGTCLYDGTTGDFTIESDADIIKKECDSEKEKLQNEIDKLNDQITNLQNQINEKDAAINSLQSNLEDNQNEILTLQGEKQVLQNALDAKNQELAELNEKLASVTATASDVLSGKTILTSSGIITGTMNNYSGLNMPTNTLTKAIISVIDGQWENATGKGATLSFHPNFSGYVDSNTTINQNVYGLHPSIIRAGELIGGNGSEDGVGAIRGTYTSDATATASQILSGKTAYVNGSKITGTMTNKSGTTTAATTVTESGTNAEITIPANGYYSTSSKISVPISTIQNNVNVSKVVSGTSTGAAINIGSNWKSVLVYSTINDKPAMGYYDKTIGIQGHVSYNNNATTIYYMSFNSNYTQVTPSSGFKYVIYY